MGVRGRKPASELALASISRIEPLERPAPPEYLTVEQAKEWRAIVEANPADKFPRERFGALEGYVSHVIKRRKVDELITKYESSPDFDIKEYQRILKMHKEETAAIASLSVRLGIANSTAYEKRKGASPVKKPWD